MSSGGNLSQQLNNGLSNTATSVLNASAHPGMSYATQPPQQQQHVQTALPQPPPQQQQQYGQTALPQRQPQQPLPAVGVVKNEPRSFEVEEQEEEKSYDFIKLILYDCMHCGQRYGDQMVVEFHLERKHNTKSKDYHVTYMCKICDKPFPGENDLDDHLKRYH